MPHSIVMCQANKEDLPEGRGQNKWSKPSFLIIMWPLIVLTNRETTGLGLREAGPETQVYVHR